MDQQRAKLVSVVLRSIGDVQVRQQFDETLSSYLTVSGSVALLQGTSSQAFANSLTSTFIQVSGDMTEQGLDREASMLWNPTTAALLHFVTGNLLGNTVKTEKPPQDNKTKKEKPSSSRKDTSAPKQVAPSSKLTPASKPALPSNKTEASQKDEIPEQLPSIEVRNSLEIHSRMNEVPLYHMFPWISKLCNAVECQFCRKMFRHTKVTACQSHPMQPCYTSKVPCHPSGHYPHVGKSMWRIQWNRHRKAYPFEPSTPPSSPNMIHWELCARQNSSESPNGDRNLMTNQSCTSSTDNLAMEVSTLALESVSTNTVGSGSTIVATSLSTPSTSSSQPTSRPVSDFSETFEDLGLDFLTSSSLPRKSRRLSAQSSVKVITKKKKTSKNVK